MIGSLLVITRKAEKTFAGFKLTNVIIINAEICRVIPVFFQNVCLLFLMWNKFTATPEM